MTEKRLGLEDLEKLCEGAAEESLTLEFKVCKELKIGSEFHDKSRTKRNRTRDDILDELTRDVTAFLNAAGGRIIYGIRDKDSRADQVDCSNPFCKSSREDNIYPEKVVDWLRAHVQPPPSVHPYRVFQDASDDQSPWYLVIDIPQGEQAYMARDHRFYKRVGATVRQMEQYEVVDVMNPVRGAALELRVCLRDKPHTAGRKGWIRVEVDIAVTSTNFVASEYGALKLTAAYPVQFDQGLRTFPIVMTPRYIGMPIEGEGDTPWAEQAMVSWGASTGTVVFPGHWHDFGGQSLVLEVPQLETMRDPTYLVQMELFTLNSHRKKHLFAIRREDYENDLEMIAVDASNRGDLIGAFWRTYHEARLQLQSAG